jgi:hypothetical protein
MRVCSRNPVIILRNFCPGHSDWANHVTFQSRDGPYLCRQSPTFFKPCFLHRLLSRLTSASAGRPFSFLFDTSHTKWRTGPTLFRRLITLSKRRIFCAMRWESDIPELHGAEGISRYKYRIKFTGNQLPVTVGPKSFDDGTLSCVSTLHGGPGLRVDPRLSCNGCGER